MLMDLPVKVLADLDGNVVYSQYEKVELDSDQVKAICDFLLCLIIEQEGGKTTKKNLPCRGRV